MLSNEKCCAVFFPKNRKDIDMKLTALNKLCDIFVDVIHHGRASTISGRKAKSNDFRRAFFDVRFAELRKIKKESDVWWMYRNFHTKIPRFLLSHQKYVVWRYHADGLSTSHGWLISTAQFNCTSCWETRSWNQSSGQVGAIRKIRFPSNLSRAKL